MKVVGLISGGKDSIYSMLQCIAAGHEIVAVANMEPETEDEIDSYMFQTVGHEVVSLISLTLGLPIFRYKTKGVAFCKNKVYDKTSEDEVEDLFELLSEVKNDISIDGVSVGAIASDYQRTRTENVCSRLGLVCFAYLWKRDQAELLQEMIDCQMEAIIIKVACMGLKPDTHLGMPIKEILPQLLRLKEKYGVNVCGEGGEYETLTLNCPLYHRKIEITESEIIKSSNDAFAPVGFLHVKKAILKPKGSEENDPFVHHLNNIKAVQSIVKKPIDYIQDCVDEDPESMSKTKSKLKLVSKIPFPFESDEEDAEEPAENLSEYKKDLNHSKSHVNFKPKVFESNLVPSDSLKCFVSNTSGWCYIGNVTGVTLSSVLVNMQKNLERNKYNFNDAVFVSLYVSNLSEFSKINKVYSQHMPNTLPPARVCVETCLPSECNVVMSVVAHKIVSKSQKLLNSANFSKRDALHVRSISNWAPANIGPYSQCIRIGDIFYLAGQIPLIPGSMEILHYPVSSQCKLTLRHVRRILEAMDGSLNFSNVLQAVCYVTSESIASDVIDLWSSITNADHSTVTSIVISKLPKNAPMEWEIIACKSVNSEVEEKTECVDDFIADMKRCVYRSLFVSSLVCKFSLMRNRKGVKTFLPQGLNRALDICVHFLKADCKNPSPFCILKLFYKTGDSAVLGAIKNITDTFTDSKVAFTLIPVNGCETPEICLTLIGICH